MDKKKIGLPSAISVCIGLIVASSCLLSLGQGVGMAGGGFIISMFIVLILNICLALSFSELNLLMPDVNGGLGQYTKAALGNMPAMISNISAYVIVNLLAASVEIAMCGSVISNTFLQGVPAPLMSLVFLGVLGIVNYFGMDLFTRIQNIVVSLLLLSLLGMGIISFFKLGTGTVITDVQQALPEVTGMSGYLSLAALAFWLFIGIEFVIPVAKDMKNPGRNVLLAMILGIGLLFIIQSVLGIGMTNYVTLTELRTSAMPHMVFARNLLGRPGEIWMGIVTVLAGISTANTVLGGIPRVLQGMAESDLFPSVFSKVNRHKVPLAGLLLLAGGNAVLLITGLTESAGLSTILLAASCFWLLSYILVNIAVLVLRKKYPDHPARNKKLTLWGIPQVLAIIGDIYMILHIAEGAERLFIYRMCGIIFAVMFLFCAVWIKVVKKEPLFEGISLEKINRIGNTQDYSDDTLDYPGYRPI